MSVCPSATFRGKHNIILYRALFFFVHRFMSISILNIFLFVGLMKHLIILEETWFSQLLFKVDGWFLLWRYLSSKAYILLSVGLSVMQYYLLSSGGKRFSQFVFKIKGWFFSLKYFPYQCASNIWLKKSVGLSVRLKDSL